MRQLSSIERAIKDVPFFTARYENFIKRLENQGAFLGKLTTLHLIEVLLLLVAEAVALKGFKCRFVQSERHVREEAGFSMKNVISTKINSRYSK